MRNEPLAKPDKPPQASASGGIPEDRRGFVGFDEAGRFVHYCPECGAWGSFGFGVFPNRGQLGTWYCGAHKPKDKDRG